MLKFQTSPENEAIVEALSEQLAKIPLGGTVDYLALRRFVPAWKGSHWLLRKARERTEKNLGVVFECVRNVGVKRLATAEVPNVGLSALRKIRRGANRGRKRLQQVNTNSMTESDQRKVVGMTAMLGAVSIIADGRKALMIGAVAEPAKPIPPQNIIDMFKV